MIKKYFFRSSDSKVAKFVFHASVSYIEMNGLLIYLFSNKYVHTSIF